MWGCLKGLLFVFAAIFIVLALIIGGGWWYLGTASFADLIRLRIERTLEARLGRDVSIGSVQIVRTRPQRVILNDVRIANAPGGVDKYFATVRQVEITGGIDSFWGREVNVGRIDIRDPRLNFEVFPAGSKLTHNFPQWKSGPRSKYEIVHVDLNKLFVTGGVFSFNDRQHEITALATGLASEITVTRKEDLYAGIATSPSVTVRIQDYKPFEVDLRGGFRFTPNDLELQSVALRGSHVQAFLAGHVTPLSEGVYDLSVRAQTSLESIKDIFQVNQTLAGAVALDTRLRGKQGDFSLTGRWSAPKISADVYDLAGVRGTLDVNGQRTLVGVERAAYGGGTINADYELSNYAEPYPMHVDLRYDRISLEQLFNDWGVKDTGLRGAATGTLAYQWEKDRILEGSGEGSAKLARNARAFSNAQYPIPLAGAADFSLNRGVIRFRNANLDTGATKVAFGGTLAIEGLRSDLALDITSSDFSELDRIGFNFAHSAGKKTYTLLGLGGSGHINGTVKGPLDTPMVLAHIDGTGTKYNNVQLGDASIDLRYDGPKSVLTFDRALFVDDGGRLALQGTVSFPDKGPGPRFDIAVDATNYPVDKAAQAVGLDLQLGHGRGTGTLVVTGTPDAGTVRFTGMTIRQADATLKLNGDVAWAPGKGNIRFNLDIAAMDYPVGDIITFLDLGTMPVTGKLTGTMHLEGTKENLEGAGSVTVRNGSVFGEPVDIASADIAFTQGKVRATHIVARGPAGEITGEAQMNLVTNDFSYSINAPSLNLSRVKALESLAGLLGGNLTITSQGAGTLDNPELVVEATLNGATLRGLTLPPGSAPPNIYFAIRGGRLIIRGNIADLLTIEGEGTVGKDLAVNGDVHISVPDIGKLLTVSPKTATIPASGSMTADLHLSGALSSLEALRIDTVIPQLALKIGEHELAAPRPLRMTLSGGRFTFDDFQLQHPDSTFEVTGFAELTGAKRLAVNLRGNVEAALAQLFVTGLRANGVINVAAQLGGTLGDPSVTGSAEIRDGEFKFPGFPQLIDNVFATLVFRGDRIDIDSARATVGGGQVALGGFVTLNGVALDRVRLTLQGTSVAIRYFEGISLDSDFALLLSGDKDRMILQGDVTVNRGLYFKDIDFRQSLLNVLLSRRSVAPTVAASWQDRVTLRMHVVAANTLAVKNNLADVTGSADLDVTGTLANPVVIGDVTLNEGGSLRFQNTDYRVVRGTINFQNPFRIDPYFDITVEGRISGTLSEGESGPIEVTVNVTGTLDRITPTITSDPPTSDITLLSLLGFGGTSNNNTSATNTSAALVGQSLLYQSLGSLIGSKILPFADSFTYDPGLIDTGSGSGPKVTFEKRISNSVRLLVVYNLNDHKNREVIEWLVNREWTLQLTRDESAAEYRLDARFRRRYNGYWTWGHRGEPDIATAVSFQKPEAPSTRTETPDLENPAAAVPPPTGPIVATVTFRADGNFDTTSLEHFVAVKPGAPLSIRDVQSSIKNLFATANFRDVRVNSTPNASGTTDVVFVLSLNYRVGSIKFDNASESDRQRSQSDLVVRVGDIFSLNAVDRSAVAIQNRLRRNGYLEATVDPEVNYERERNLASVTFHVDRGTHAKVATIAIQGDTAPFTQRQLINPMKLDVGRDFSVDEARRDADRIQNFIVSKDYRRARVTYNGYTYDPASKSVSLTYNVEVGPRVRIEIKGDNSRAVRRLIPFSGTQEYSEDAVDRAASRIVEHFQELGYYNAAVDTESRLESNIWTTTFNVQPGERYRVTQVTFTGNMQLSDKQLVSVVNSAPNGGFRNLVARIFRRPTAPTAQQISADRDSLESYYRLQGFSEAVVGDPVVKTNPDHTMTIDFPVTEGTQTLVTSVRVEGNEQVESRYLPTLTLEEGKPLNPQFLHDDLIALQTFYADRGNAEVQVTPRVDVTPDKSASTVTYVISEGPRVEVDQIVVRGNTYTSSELILRKSGLVPRSPFSYTSILEAQRNLYRLGIFQRVDIQPEQAGTSVSDRNVTIQVEEGQNLTISGSVGVLAKRRTEASEQDISPRISAAIAHRNLFGTGRYLGLETIYSSLQREAYLTYREPYIGRWNVPVQFTIFRTDDSTRKETRIVQSGSSIEASKIAENRTRWSLRYEYKISECKSGEICDLIRQDVPVPGIDRQLLDIQISSITPTFFWDKRDDVINPRRGFFTSASVEYAFPFISAEAHFLKEFVQGAWYLPVSESTVFAVSGRAGVIQTFSDSKVPLSERFVAGGDTSHRAFPLDLLGTLCPDERLGTRCEPTLVTLEGSGRVAPIGGKGLFLLNAEYRFPIFSSVGGALFTDVGNVFANQIHFNQLRYGLGGGIRYISPVGPLRFDIGWPLQRRPHEPAFSYFITLGYAF